MNIYSDSLKGLRIATLQCSEDVTLDQLHVTNYTGLFKKKQAIIKQDAFKHKIYLVNKPFGQLFSWSCKWTYQSVLLRNFDPLFFYRIASVQLLKKKSFCF